MSDGQDSESEQDGYAEDNPRKDMRKTLSLEETKTEPNVTITHDTEVSLKTPHKPERGKKTQHGRVVNIIDGERSCATEDPAPMRRLVEIDTLRSTFPHRYPYPPDLTRPLNRWSIAHNLFHPAQVNIGATLYSCATMDHALAAISSMSTIEAGITSPVTSRLSMNFQHHALAKVH